MPSRNRRCVGVAVVCLVLAAPGWASAAAEVHISPAATVDTIVETTAPVTETVTDIVEPTIDTVTPVTETVRDTAAPVTETIRDTTDPVREAIKDTTRPVTDGLTEALDPVREVIDDSALLGDGDPAGDGAVDAVPPRTSGDPSRARTSNPSGPPPITVQRDAGEQRPERSGAPTGGSLTPTPPIARASDGASLSEIIQGLGQTSRQFSFPLTIAALVLLFLGVQGRLDARDPKLAARGEDEELAFV